MEQVEHTYFFGYFLTLAIFFDYFFRIDTGTGMIPVIRVQNY